MSDLRKAAELALEALRNAEVVYMEQLNAMYALQEALAQPVDAVNMSQERVDETVKNRHEPVAWVECAVIPWLQSKSTNVYATTKLHRIPSETYDTPLYTAPPKREWVGLTDEEIEQCFVFDWSGEFYANWRKQTYEAIKAKLKEKNT